MSIIEQIKKAEKISLSEDDIRTLVDNKVEIHAYQDLEKYNNIDDVLGQHGACILLYQTAEDYGHWVSLFKVDDNLLEFFDSLGWQMDQELKFSEYNIRRHGGEAIPHLTDLINNSNYKVISNTVQLQKNAKDDNTCGRWASLRVRLRHLSLKTFVKLFSDKTHFDPDFWVSAVTIFFS